MTDPTDIFHDERADLYRAFRTIAAHCYRNDCGDEPDHGSVIFQRDYVYPLIVHTRINHCNSDAMNDIEDECPRPIRRRRTKVCFWWRRYLP
ncbi:MAG: hypothetical protein ABL907_26380 [Hyphomicrobium sp.]